MRALKMATASVALAGSLFVSGLAAAPADAVVNQAGLINVALNDVNIANDVNVGVAAGIAAQLCNVKVGPVAVLGQAVDTTGATRTVCQTSQGAIKLTQA